MRQLQLQEIKKVQLEILSKVDSFCIENKIRYSLSFGTLLGAVRHKGYIPWDDDIDLMMPRPDYDKFLSTFNSFSDYYRVRTHPVEPDYPYIFAKVEDTRTIFIEAINISYDIGINIDIFPVDGVPARNNTFNRYFKSIKFLRNILLIKLIKLDFKRRSKIKNMILFVAQVILKPITYQRLIGILNQRISKYSYTDSQKAMMTCINTRSSDRVDREIFENYCELQFENNTYPVIADYKNYLGLLYGDYMKLPPIEQQTTHHAYNAYYR